MAGNALDVQVHSIKNRHGSARKAWDAWRFKQAGRGLWAVPPDLNEPIIHVTGVSLRTGNVLQIQFQKDHIVIMKRRKR